MQSSGLQYHVDLAQTIVHQAMAAGDLQNELYAHLIRMGNARNGGRLQAWKLMAVAASCFHPKQYALMWLLKRHLQRYLETG